MALIPTWTWGDLVLTSSPFLFSFGSDFGAPVTATEALAQLLTDGEIEVSTRASNRTIEFTVYVEGSDLLAIAAAEALLVAQADKPRNTLTYNPGDGVAPPTVFETFRAQVSFIRDDDAETSGLRRYDVSMKAAPFGRSAAVVETPAVDSVAVPTVVTISAGDSTTGWTGKTTLADAGSNLYVTDVVDRQPYGRFTSATSVNLASTHYVSIVMWGLHGGEPALLAGSSSNAYFGVLVAAIPTSTTDRVRYYFDMAGAPITTATVFTVFGLNTDSISFNSLQRTDAIPSTSTRRQVQRFVKVNGSARTQGSVAIEHPSSALGSTMVYTSPVSDNAGYSPPLRQYRTSGGTVTTDASLVSGSRDLLDTALVFDIPVSNLIAGTHLLLARVRSDTVSTQAINYTAQVRQGSTDIGAATTGSLSVPFTSTAWRNVVLGRMMLPPTDVPVESTAVVRLTIAAASAGASNIDLDEGWLFNTTVGALTWVECGSASPSAGGSSNRLWLDTDTTDRPRPAIYQGFAANRSDAFYPGSNVVSFGIHKFSPPLVNVFTVTSNAVDAAVTLEHFPRWHTHAAS